LVSQIGEEILKKTLTQTINNNIIRLMNPNTIQQLFKVSSTSHHTMTLTEREELFGWQKIFEFPNGYGASVVVHDFSYGLELALLDESGNITQHPDITDDVAGFLNVDSANDLLEKIAKLPKKVLTGRLEPVTM
jgi:hypothetical protein